ncbi:hypothetical protein PROFUN_01475 [Planoprotostelium fungivorum]|uniref:F-box domain-containing protein n=1 Tax=Planoprotostelium fungivorum TaxID=1890364 RepID=A0A2P6NTC1_9EUKA|nr:hypothetical protein PROFUN_01475 [Planoprotostelium fungivorum]
MSVVGSPPTGSPSGMYNNDEEVVTSFHSTFRNNQRNWEEKRDKFRGGLEYVLKIERVLLGEEVESLPSLKEELTNKHNFYSLLLRIPHFVETDRFGYFSVLPSEIVYHIFSYLDYRSLCTSGGVCTKFRDVSRDDPIWERLCITSEIPLDLKFEGKTWKWLALSKLRKWPQNAFKDGPGCFFYDQAEDPEKKDEYCGDWVNNKRTGYGTYIWMTGSSYRGQWKEDQRSGKGERVWPNGNKYIGEYANHKRHGKGEFTFTNGSIFRGQFHENKFIFGTYTWPNGRVYTGEWANVFRHGQGHYSWPDGRTYKGMWKKDKRHGQGEYTWPDGDSFTGNFVDGKRVGAGKLTLKNGDIYQQEWKEERFDEFFKGIDSNRDVKSTKVEAEEPTVKKRKQNVRGEVARETEESGMIEDKEDSVDIGSDDMNEITEDKEEEDTMAIDHQSPTMTMDTNNNNNNNGGRQIPPPKRTRHRLFVGKKWVSFREAIYSGSKSSRERDILEKEKDTTLLNRREHLKSILFTHIPH